MFESFIDLLKSIGDHLRWVSVALVAIPFFVLTVMAFVAWSNARAVAPALNTLAGNTKINADLDLAGLVV